MLVLASSWFYIFRHLPFHNNKWESLPLCWTPFHVDRRVTPCYQIRLKDKLTIGSWLLVTYVSECSPCLYIYTNSLSKLSSRFCVHVSFQTKNFVSPLWEHPVHALHTFLFFTDQSMYVSLCVVFMVMTFVYTYSCLELAGSIGLCRVLGFYIKNVSGLSMWMNFAFSWPFIIVLMPTRY